MKPVFLAGLCAAAVACGSDRRSSGPPAGGAAGSEGEGDAGAESEGEGEGESGGPGEGGGGGGEGEGEDVAAPVLDPHCAHIQASCPEDLPKAFTYSFRTADCVAVSFDYYAAPQDGLRPVILLLHDGIRGFRRDWQAPGVDHFIDALRCSGWTVINADLRGHFQSKERLCRGWPGESCDDVAGCVSGACGDASGRNRCAEPTPCDPALAPPDLDAQCGGALACDLFGRCLQAVPEDQSFLSPQEFGRDDWAMVPGDIDSMFEFLDILAHFERTYIFGVDGSTTGVTDELDQTDFPGLAQALQEAGFEPNALDVELGLFVRLNVGGAERNYSIRSVAGDIMTFRSDKPGDWLPGDNEDGFYSTTPLTEELEAHPWLFMQRANLPFDPDRFALVAPGLGGNAALRYAATAESRVKATVLLSPVLAGADGLQQSGLRALAAAVEAGAVLALAGSEHERSVSAIEPLAEVGNPRVATELVRGTAAIGIPLLEDVSVTNGVRCWIGDRFAEVEAPDEAPDGAPAGGGGDR